MKHERPASTTGRFHLRKHGEGFGLVVADRPCAGVLDPDQAPVLNGRHGGLVSAVAEVLADYVDALAGSLLAVASRAKYLGHVRSYLVWMIAESERGQLRGDPLTEPTARDGAVRDYRRARGPEGAPTTINNTLIALDDFHVRLGIGPASVPREDPPARTAPVALNVVAARRYLREIERTDSVRDKVIAALPY